MSKAQRLRLKPDGNLQGLIRGWHCLEALTRGINVAVVFENKPATWHGFECIDGDQHDLRQLDAHEIRGYVIALSPKGRKAKADKSGFVVR